MHRHRLAGLILGGLVLHSCGSAPQPASPPPASCVVERVGDGDTFSCRDGRKVRLLGIDTPELAQGEPGRQAHAALRRLLPNGTMVRLERDVALHDRFGRELAYAWTGARMINETLVREGWAMLYTLPPNVKYAGRLDRAQTEARAARAGLWESGGFECSPRAWRRRECAARP